MNVHVRVSAVWLCPVVRLVLRPSTHAVNGQAGCVFLHALEGFRGLLRDALCACGLANEGLLRAFLRPSAESMFCPAPPLRKRPLMKTDHTSTTTHALFDSACLYASALPVLAVVRSDDDHDG